MANTAVPVGYGFNFDAFVTDSSVMVGKRANDFVGQPVLVPLTDPIQIIAHSLVGSGGGGPVVKTWA